MQIRVNGDSLSMDVCVPQIISQLYYGRVILERLPLATLESLNHFDRRNMSAIHRNSDERGTFKLGNPCCPTCDKISRIWLAHKQNGSHQHCLKKEFDPDAVKQEEDVADSVFRNYSSARKARDTVESEDETDDFDSDCGLLPIEGFDSVSGLAVLTKKYCPTCDDIIDWYISSSDEICPMCDSTIRLQCAECGERFSNDSGAESRSDSWCESGRGVKTSKKGHKISSKPLPNERIRLNHYDQIKQTECPKCNKILKNLSSLRKHSRICRELFRCEYCAFQTSHEPSLKRHLKGKHWVDRQYYEMDDNALEILREKGKRSKARRPEIQPFCLVCQRTCKKIGRKCERCGNRSLLMQCKKCGFMSDRNHNMYYHINQQCQSTYLSKGVKKSKALLKSNNVAKRSIAISRKHTSSNAKLNPDGSSIRWLCSQCNEQKMIDGRQIKCQECSSTLLMRCTRCKTKYTPIDEGCGHAAAFLQSLKS